MNIKLSALPVRKMSTQARCLFLIVSTLMVPAIANAEETQRGLKSTGPIKPYYDSPRYESVPADTLEDLTPKQVLPEVPKEPSSQISKSPSFYVKQIVVSGSTIFDKDALAGMISTYEGRQVSIEELQSLRHQLSLAYFQRGYVNSAVIIPDQDVKDGVVTFRAIEGLLGQINLSGNKDLLDFYLTSRLERGIERPLNVNSLQRAINAVQQNPLIKKVSAQLKPTNELGVVELDIAVSEADSQALSIGLDNHRSPSVGAETIRLGYVDRNLLGLGDTLSLSTSASEGVLDYGMNYSLPVLPNDATLGFFFNASESEVVEEPFDLVDIESDASSMGFTFSAPLYFWKALRFDLDTAFIIKESDAFLEGGPFPTLGALEGKSKTAVFEAGLRMSYREAAQVLAMSITMRKGLDMLDANFNGNEDVPDGKFLSFVGQLQYARRFESLPGSQIILRAAFQKSLAPLLSIEKFAVGGHTSVRGYRENQLVRDNGLTGTAEIRWAPFTDKFARDAWNLDLVGFMDVGMAWDQDVPSQDDSVEQISSLGLGAIWQPVDRLSFEGYWGFALEDEVKSDQGDDLQDDGLHFSLNYHYQF